MSELKLLPCPFCGGIAAIQQDTRYPRYGKKDTVKAYEPICTNTDCLIYKADNVYFTSEKKAIAAWNRRAQTEITGETSDGYHTFNELYHHRAVLFSVICNDRPALAWKSKLHHDGTMYDGMFIVGIETPDGQATYHYDIEPYWEMFNVQELPQAPEWDGHTPAQAIERIGKLRAQTENARQHTIQTGVCPMCEDCPDGCPVEAPNDSRNRPENEPLTLDELWQMDGEPVYIVQIHGREEWNFRRNGGLDDCCGEWTADEDINWDRYGDLWRAYRAKPERSET